MDLTIGVEQFVVDGEERVRIADPSGFMYGYVAADMVNISWSQWSATEPARVLPFFTQPS